MLRSRSSQILGKSRERLKVTPKNGVNENARVLRGVPRRHVHHIRLYNHRHFIAVAVPGSAVEGCNGAVVGEAVVAANHAERDDVAAVIQKVEALPADGGGEPGDHANLAEGSDSGAVA
ncbi:hypothetical protein PIB30_090379 [Stylosanthes scabra]|uniref:Uncharacterized protein n=1 Tax=Stylosanthes scabra TaxID=79078 RepID=A0ABU6RUY1_9FABA|nr:hypothetical protein [Stylosanthes scabra]